MVFLAARKVTVRFGGKEKRKRSYEQQKEGKRGLAKASKEGLFLAEEKWGKRMRMEEGGRARGLVFCLGRGGAD